ncbi:MAG: CPBP family intramembrane metalloprotease [Lachnospiraceae bacterium]|nr:CPBP family intramembrane metalloprotease [Lachnospiraceae bacterium]
MGELFGIYKVFTPQKYRIFAVYLGTILMMAVALLNNILYGKGIGLIVTAVLLLAADVYLDLFVFQGIFGKNFGFGLLRNSDRGLKVIKKGVLADRLRSLFQHMIVMMFTGFMSRDYFIEQGYIEGPADLILMILTIGMTEYVFNTLILNISRRHETFFEGFLLDMLYILAGSAVVAGVGFLFMNESVPAPYPMLAVMGFLTIIVTYAMVERVGRRYINSFEISEKNIPGDDSGRRMWLFILIAFGLDALMIPAMYIGKSNGTDLTAFMVAQMMYPACGVALGGLLSYRRVRLPKIAYWTIITTGLITLILAASSVMLPLEFEMAGTTTTILYYISNFVIMIASVLMIVGLCVAGKEKRENAGFRFRNPGRSLLITALFIVLYFARVFILCIADGLINDSVAEAVRDFVNIFSSGSSVQLIPAIVINLPLTFVMFLGEEYGWRYYLQPIMQKKLGRLPGVILLGILWGIWHVGADFTYYSDGTGVQMLLAQIVTCVSLGIFFGYAYMKTDNIWVPVMMHFFNNNLIMFLSGDASVNAMQGNVVSWTDIPLMVIGAAVFWLFAFASIMRGEKECPLYMRKAGVAEVDTINGTKAVADGMGEAV